MGRQIYGRFDGFTIRAQKGPRSVSNYPRWLFRHTFEQGGSRIVGNADGSITLHPHKRRALWDMYPVADAPGRQEPFLSNPLVAVVGNPAGSRAHAKRIARGRRRRQGRRSGVIHREGSNQGGRMAKKRKQRRAHRNPFGLPRLSEVKSDAMDAVAVAGGMFAAPLVASIIPLPDSFQSGAAKYVTKGVIALGIGMLGGALLGHRIGKLVTVGALGTLVLEGVQDVSAGFGLLPSAAAGAPAAKPALSLGYGGMGSYTGYRGLESYTGYEYGYA